MALNKSNQFIIDNRRRLVTQLRLEGMSEAQIQQELENRGEVNPDTGKPWSAGTIHNDLIAVREQWREEARRNLADHKARVLAEIQDVKYRARAKMDWHLVLKALEQECKLLGLDSPEKREIVGRSGGPIEIKTWVDLMQAVDEE